MVERESGVFFTRSEWLDMRLTGGEAGHVAPTVGMVVAKVYRLSSEETLFVVRNMTLATRLDHF